MTKQVTIGITGGIGSGKTYVAEIFKKLGYPVFDADTEAKKLMIDDAEVVSQIKHIFGDEAYNSAGELNRQYISEIVFRYKEKLSVLNGIVHPAVQKRTLEWKQEQLADILFKEAALLVETGSYKQLDYLLVVVADEATRINRVMNRDGVSKDAVKSRMENQLPQSEKVKLADFVIQNDGKSALVPQLMTVLDQIKRK